MLDAPAIAAAARAAEAAPGRGDEAERGAQAAPAGVGERDDRRADRGLAVGRGSQSTGATLAGVDLDDGEVEVGVDAGTRPGLAAAVGERDGDLLAAQVVCVREHAPGATTTPLPRPHPRPKPTTAGPTRSATAPMAL